MSARKLDAGVIRDLFDCADGQLFWRRSIGGRTRPGAFAGFLHKESGSYRVTIFGRPHMRARLVWAWTHGQLPSGRIVHINGNRLDDRAENLIDLPIHQAHVAAHHKPHLPGVKPTKRGRWTANITIANHHRHLGSFHSEQAAHEAFARAHAETYGEASPYYQPTGVQKC